MKVGEIMAKKFKFEYLSPINIQVISNKIENSDIYKSRNVVIFTLDDFKNSYDKLINDNCLNERDYMILFSFLNEINKKKAFDTLINKLLNEEDILIVLGKIFNLLVSSLYLDSLDYYQKEKLFNMIYNNINKIKLLTRFNFLREKFLNSNSLKDYFLHITQDISKIKYNIYLADKSEAKSDVKYIFNKIIRSYYIDISTKFYFECLITFLSNNYLDNNIWSSPQDFLSHLSFENKKTIIKNVLFELYKNRSTIDISEYPDKFFSLLEDLLGIDTNDYKWDDISLEEKSIYLLWIKDRNIKEFFETVSKDGDIDRLRFWRGYLDKISDIYNHENLNNILAMEFDSHIIIEFAEKNNATYIYSKDVLSVKDIKEIANNKCLSKYSKIKKFKGGYPYIEKLYHYNKWQINFEIHLNRLGYIKDKY